MGEFPACREKSREFFNFWPIGEKLSPKSPRFQVVMAKFPKKLGREFIRSVREWARFEQGRIAEEAVSKGAMIKPSRAGDLAV
jgi:hypothetical protein